MEERKRYAVLRNLTTKCLTITKGDGIYLFDDAGHRYIDGSSGSSLVCNIGHGVKDVAPGHDAASGGADLQPHPLFRVHPIPGHVRPAHPIHASGPEPDFQCQRRVRGGRNRAQVQPAVPGGKGTARQAYRGEPLAGLSREHHRRPVPRPGTRSGAASTRRACCTARTSRRPTAIAVILD